MSANLFEFKQTDKGIYFEYRSFKQEIDRFHNLFRNTVRITITDNYKERE